MNAILALITALEPLALQELQLLAGLSPQMSALIQGITGALNIFLGLYKSGNGNSVTAASILAALQASIAAFQAQSPDGGKALIITAALLKALQAGMEANANLTTVNPDTLQPISPIQ